MESSCLIRFVILVSCLFLNAYNCEETSCAVEDKIVDLQEEFHESILRPRNVNIRQCVGSADLEDLDEECAPTSYQPLTVVYNHTGNVYIQLVDDLVVENCSIVPKASCLLKDKVVDLHEEFNNLIEAPTSANIRQCVGTPGLERQNKKCVPSVNSSIDVLINVYSHRNRSLETIITSANIIVENCTIVDLPSKPPCELQDRVVDLQEHFHESIQRPRSVNVGRCVGSSDLENESKECIPTLFKPLEILIKLRGRIVIDVIRNLVIAECGIVDKPSACRLEDNVVNLPEHLGLGESLIRPIHANIRQCVGSTELESQNKKCVPSAYKPIDTLQYTYNERSFQVIETIPDLVVQSCSIVDIVPDCELKNKTLNLQDYFNDSSIITPESVNVGECVGSPDLEQCTECVPTSTQPINIVRNNSDTLAVDAISDFVIQECGIVNKQPCCEVRDKFLRLEDNQWPWLLEPRAFNTRKCVSSSSDLQDICVPTSYEPFDFILNVTGTITVERVDDFSISECGFVPRCELQAVTIDLREQIGDFILFPRTANIGRCVGSPHDSIPCRPSSYKSLTVVVSHYGTISLQILPDVIITGC